MQIKPESHVSSTIVMCEKNLISVADVVFQFVVLLFKAFLICEKLYGEVR